MSDLKVLILENDGKATGEIRDCLHLLNSLEVSWVSCENQVILEIEETHPNLVLIDIYFWDETKSCNWAKFIENTYQIPVIYLLDSQDKNLISKLKNHQSSGYLIKPFQAIHLHSVIQIAIHKYHYDSLTNLPDRFFFQKKLNQLLTADYQSKTDSNLQVRQKYDPDLLIPILSLSLDRINRINGTFGHSIGNSVLQTIGRKLSEGVPGCYLIARLEAAEFAMILEPVEQKQEAAKIAQMILEIIGQPIAVNGYEFYLTASIGISFYPWDGRDHDGYLYPTDQQRRKKVINFVAILPMNSIQ